MSTPDPHAGQTLQHRGPAIGDARIVIVIVHGRGDSAAGILGLAEELHLPDVAYLAPQAAGHTWYPHSFLSPMEDNEPWLGSALRVLGTLTDSVIAQGVPPERLGFLGFSQGACLALEFVARHARRYAAVAGLSGGLIGPDGTPRDYTGSLDGTPVFLGCSDVDPHIPLTRVRETTTVLRSLKAAVDERIYPRMGHTVNRDEIGAVRALIRG